MNPTRTQTISLFLKAKTHSDLAALYTPAMEVQVNVAKDNGKRIKIESTSGRGSVAYTDDFQTWKAFRIPYNANSEPTYEDRPISFSLEEHCEGIGMTGWDWKDRVSRWCAYDFDAIVGHSDKHSKKLTDEQLCEVQHVLSEIPFVSFRKSTSGRGLHMYVFLKPVRTSNHNEHAALARSILAMLSGMTGIDLGSRVDVCGGNMWVWHRKMYDLTGKQNEGLQLVKAGVALEQIPSNWRDHMNVVTRKANRTVPSFVQDIPINDPDKLFDELSGQRARIPLDAQHRRLVEYLQSNNCMWWWDNDNWLLITHTVHLKEAHEALCMRGRFETLAVGSDHGSDHNVFCFPLRGGSWACRRYSLGVKEADTWEQDGSRWTRCFLNRDPDLPTLARMYGGVEHEKGGYHFRAAEAISQVLAALCIPCNLPNFVMNRPGMIKPLKNENKLSVSFNAENNDDGSKLKDWYREKNMWKRIFNYVPPTSENDSSSEFDDVIRHLMTMDGGNAGWVLKRDGVWCEEPIEHLRIALSSMGKVPREVTQILGGSIFKAWKLVNKPFQSEYPGNREWNRNAAKFACVPSTDLDNLSFPNWIKILKHCGQGLDASVAEHEWCKTNDILTGADFLKLWIATLIQKPTAPTTYLAFWGEQDSGKSIFHEAITEFLIHNCTMRVESAFRSAQNFNAELQNVILGVIEETDMKKDKLAANKVKDWVTSPTILIHPKHVTPYLAPNCLHFIQCSNSPEEAPVFPGDTRITLINVPALNSEEKIPKEEFRILLKKEAPDFLAALLSMELPKTNDRLAVPTIETETKRLAEDRGLSALELFIKDQVHEVNGHCISAEDFYDHFMLWLDEKERGDWSKQKIGRNLPERYPRGRLSNDQAVHYGNMSFDPNAKPSGAFFKEKMFIKKR